MKKLEAVIQACKADQVREALAWEKIPRITIFEVKGGGSSQGKLKEYRGTQYIEDSAEVKIEIVVDDDDAERIAELILNNLQSGNIANGEITILPAEQVKRVRVGEPSYSRSNWIFDSSPKSLMTNNVSFRVCLRALKKKLLWSKSRP